VRNYRIRKKQVETSRPTNYGISYWYSCHVRLYAGASIAQVVSDSRASCVQFYSAESTDSFLPNQDPLKSDTQIND